MVNKIETIYPVVQIKVQFKIPSEFQVWHETPEESQKTHWPKHYWMRNNQNGGWKWNGNLYNINKIQNSPTAWRR